MGKTNDLLSSQVRESTITVIGNAAKCSVVLGRKISGGSENGAISGKDEDLCQYSKVHLPSLAPISPSSCNWAPGESAPQNFIEASLPSPDEMLSVQPWRCSSRIINLCSQQACMIPLPPPQREEVHHELVYFYLVS
jgi:hypothetical protein